MSQTSDVVVGEGDYHAWKTCSLVAGRLFVLGHNLRHAMTRWNFAGLAIGISAVFLVGCSAAITSPAQSPDDAMELLHPNLTEVYHCLQDKGWDVRLVDAGIEVDNTTVSTEQLDLYTADDNACWAVIEARVDGMTVDQIHDVYMQELATRECLLENDYEVAEPPTEQQYTDSFHGQRWTAYGASNIAMSPPSDEDFKRISQACPQPSWSMGAS